MGALESDGPAGSESVAGGRRCPAGSGGEAPPAGGRRGFTGWLLDRNMWAIRHHENAVGATCVAPLRASRRRRSRGGPAPRARHGALRLGGLGRRSRAGFDPRASGGRSRRVPADRAPHAWSPLAPGPTACSAEPRRPARREPLRRAALPLLQGRSARAPGGRPPRDPRRLQPPLLRLPARPRTALPHRPRRGGATARSADRRLRVRL